MSVFESLGDDVYCLDADYIRNQFAAFYLMREGDEVAIIETGTCHSIPNLKQTMHALEIEPEQIKYIIPTHIHLDHAGGAGAMMAMFPQAELIIHPRGARHMIEPDRLISGSIEVYGKQRFHELYGEIVPVDEARVLIAEDQDRYYLNNRELLFFDTPGHARHHFCIFDARSRGIFTGDTFGSAYPPLKRLTRGLIPTTTPVHFDPVALPHSINRLLELDPEKAYLTHYGELVNPKAHGESLKQWIAQFVDLCEAISPGPDDPIDELQTALGQMIVNELQSEMDPNDIQTLLSIDIKLNAQGILHWWHHNRHV